MPIYFKRKKVEVTVIGGIAANSTYENDGPVEVTNNVGAGATVKIKNGGIQISGDVEDGAKIKVSSAWVGGSNGIETKGRTGNGVILVSDRNLRINNAGNDLKVKAKHTIEAGNLGRNAHVEAGRNLDVGDVGDNSQLSSGHNLNAARIGKHSSVASGHSLLIQAIMLMSGKRIRQTKQNIQLKLVILAEMRTWQRAIILTLGT